MVEKLRVFLLQFICKKFKLVFLEFFMDYICIEMEIMCGFFVFILRFSQLGVQFILKVCCCYNNVCGGNSEDVFRQVFYVEKLICFLFILLFEYILYWNDFYRDYIYLYVNVCVEIKFFFNL